LGVYATYKKDDHQFHIMIQASTSLTSSVFEAEAQALSLAAKIANLLNIDRPTFLADNQVLAKVAASRRLDNPLLNWESRNTLATFFQDSTAIQQVYHIRRNSNEVAHNCANQELRRS
jgi:hypothetical protein